MDKKLTYASAAAVGAGSAVVYICWLWWSWRKQQTKLPEKWRKVGELSDIIMFPVKSLGVFRALTFECKILGLSHGWLTDRTLAVIDLDGKYVTGGRMPKMVLVSPSISGSVLTLQAPGMMQMSIDLAVAKKSKVFRAAVWDKTVVPACDCGEEAARWLSQFLLQKDTGLRLIYYPLDSGDLSLRNKICSIFSPTETLNSGAFSDKSYTLISESSIADLNSRLEEPVTAQRFRNNFIVKGTQAFEEDHWDWVKIGNVVFRNVEPCARCIFTLVDPETGLRNKKIEPLRTLKTYRQIKDPAFKPKPADSPAMGINLGLRGPSGTVKLGDPVYIGFSENGIGETTPPKPMIYGKSR